MSFDGSELLLKKFTDADQYSKLRQEIAQHGIIDPCLVQAYPDRLQMETGCQRLLVARELQIEALDCFIYPWQGGQPTDFDLMLQRITDLDQVRAYFRNERVTCFLDILGYLESGRIQF